MCPTKAISIAIDENLGVYLPKIDSSNCSNCSLCYKVCPGLEVNFKELSRKVSPHQPAKPNSVLLGNYLNCYTGYSNNYDVRFDSTSGGVVTQLLVFALEEGLIDGALVTRMRKDHPLEPESFIARTPEEILEASKSKYCPVSANIAIQEILEHEGKYAVVGLPCHIHGLRKAQVLNRKLRDRVILSIGLFCSHSDSFFSNDYLLKRFRINPCDVKSISYRGKGWPGILQIEHDSGKVASCHFDDWIRFHEYCFFTPDRCLLCCDHTAELADFSCGDAWLPEFSKDHVGTSLIISRNIESEEMLQLAVSKGKIRLRPISAGKVAKSQGNMRFKKNSYPVRVFLFKMFGRKVPCYVTVLPKANFIDFLRSSIIFLNKQMTSKGVFRLNPERLISWQNRLKKIYMNTIS